MSRLRTYRREATKRNERDARQPPPSAIYPVTVRYDPSVIRAPKPTAPPEGDRRGRS